MHFRSLKASLITCPPGIYTNIFLCLVKQKYTIKEVDNIGIIRTFINLTNKKLSAHCTCGSHSWQLQSNGGEMCLSNGYSTY